MSIKINGTSVITNERKGKFVKANPGVFTEVERNALTPDEGDIIYNSDNQTLEVWEGTEWVSAGSGGKVLPILDDVTISQSPNVNRFTSETFELTPSYSQDGEPSPVVSLTANVTGAIDIGSTAPASGVVQSAAIVNIQGPEKGHYWITLPNSSIQAFSKINLGNFEYAKWYTTQVTPQGIWPDARVSYITAQPCGNYQNLFDTSSTTYASSNTLSNGRAGYLPISNNLRLGYTGFIESNLLQMNIYHEIPDSSFNYSCSASGPGSEAQTITSAGTNNPTYIPVPGGVVTTWTHNMSGGSDLSSRRRNVRYIAFKEKGLVLTNSTSEVTLSGEVTSDETISSVDTVDVSYVDTSTYSTGQRDSRSSGGVLFNGFTYDDITNPYPGGTSQNLISDGNFINAFDGSLDTFMNVRFSNAESDQSYASSIRDIFSRFYLGDTVSYKVQASQQTEQANSPRHYFQYRQSSSGGESSGTVGQFGKDSTSFAYAESVTFDGTVDYAGGTNINSDDWMNDLEVGWSISRSTSQGNNWRIYGIIINGYVLRNVSGATRLTISNDNTHIRINDVISPTSNPGISGRVIRRDADNTIVLDEVVGDWSSVTGSTLTWTPPTQTVSFNEVSEQRIRVRDCPREPIPGQVVTGISVAEFAEQRYLTLDTNGNVTGLSASPQSFVDQADGASPDIIFPASLSGVETDQVLLPGTDLNITMKATNEVGSTNQKASITPA